MNPSQSYRGGLLCLILFLGILFLPIFRSGMPLSDAHPSRMAEILIQYEQGFLQQHWFAGWDQRLQCGIPVGTYHYQLGYWIIALIHAAGVPLTLAYKAVMLLMFSVGFGLILHCFRRFAAGPAALLAVFALMLSPPIIDQMAQGFWHHVFALGLVALFIERMTVHRHLTASAVLELMGLYALIVLSHQYASIATGLFLLTRLPVWLRRGGLAAFAGWFSIPIGAVLLTFCYVMPIVQTRHWVVGASEGPLVFKALIGGLLGFAGLAGLDPQTGSGIAGRLIRVAFDWPSLAAIILAASLVVPWRRGWLSPPQRRFAGMMTGATVMFAVLYLNLLNWGPVAQVYPSLLKGASPRLGQYLQFSLMALAAVALSGWFGKPGAGAPVRPRWAVSRWVYWGLGCVVALTGVKTVWSFNAHHRLDTESTLPQMDAIRSTWQWLAAQEDGTARVYFEATYDTFPEGEHGEGELLRQSTIMALAPFTTGSPQAGGLINIILPQQWAAKSSGGRILNQFLDQTTPEAVAPGLRAMNFRYLVACSDDWRRFLSTTPLMREVARFGDFTIFEFIQAARSWAHCEPARPVEFAFDPANDARMTARLDAGPATRLNLSVAWHPFWTATANDRPVPLEPDAYGLITLPIAETGPVQVELRYRVFQRHHLAINLLALAAWLTALIVIRRRARHHAHPMHD